MPLGTQPLFDNDNCVRVIDVAVNPAIPRCGYWLAAAPKPALVAALGFDKFQSHTIGFTNGLYCGHLFWIVLRAVITRW